MARSDLLLSLVKAGTQGDNASFRRTVEAIIAEERSRQHHILAERLTEYLNNYRHHGASVSSQTYGEPPFGSVHEIHPRRNLHDLVLSPSIKIACDEFIEEQHRTELLRAHGIEPRNRIIAIGAPGNGKTSLAEAIAGELSIPLLVVRYESVITSFLGETSARLAKLFEYVRTRRCVLFFDEFDALGKERGDTQETGEIKRVVSSLLLNIDSLPSHVIVFAATNHPELLDRAAWRRFQVRLELPLPGKLEIGNWLAKFEKDLESKFPVSIQTITDVLEGCSYAEIEEFCSDIKRRMILRGTELPPKKLIDSILDQWRLRAQVRQ